MTYCAWQGLITLTLIIASPWTGRWAISQIEKWAARLNTHRLFPAHRAG